MYTCDLNWDAKGNPALFYVVSPQAEPGPLPMSTADVSGPRSPATREFRVTAWDGTKWWTSTVARTDHNYDMGSLWSDGRVWKVVAPTAAGPQPLGPERGLLVVKPGWREDLVAGSRGDVRQRAESFVYAEGGERQRSVLCILGGW